MKEVIIGDARLVYADCRDVLPTLGMVDAVITDPPYEAQAHKPMRRTRAQIELGKDDDLGFCAISEDLRKDICDFVSIRCTGWFLAFCQAEGIYPWQEAVTQTGAKYFRSMIWVKPDSSPQFNGQGPAQGYESIVTAWCGKSRQTWNGGGKRGVFTYLCNGKGRQGKHPTEKPVPLMVDLIRLFSNTGDTVLDMFVGSGTTGVAALQLGRKFIGIEKDPEYFEIACRRIQEAWDSRALLRLAEQPKIEQGTLVDK